MTLAIELGGDSLITRSRNKILAAFLDMPQATHLMFIDADIGVPAPERPCTGCCNSIRMSRRACTRSRTSTGRSDAKKRLLPQTAPADKLRGARILHYVGYTVAR